MPFGDGQITSRHLCVGAVNERNLADGAVTIDKFDSGVSGIQVVGSLPGSAVEGDMAFLTTNDKLYRYTGSAWTVAVDGSDIEDGTIVASDKIAANSITSNEILANTITAGEIAAGTITATQIAAGTITATEIASGTITADKLNVTSLDAITATMGALTVDDALTMSTGGLLRTGSATGQRIEFSNTDMSLMKFYNSSNALKATISYENSINQLRLLGDGSATDVRVYNFDQIILEAQGQLGLQAGAGAEDSSSFVTVQAEASDPDSTLIEFRNRIGSRVAYLTSVGAWRVSDGSVSAPSLSFANDSNTGFYRSASGVVRVASDGNNAWGFYRLGDSHRLLSGGATTTYLAFDSGTSQWQFHIGGTQEFALGTTGILIPNVYNSTSGSAANVYVDSAGQLFRSTSALKYKTDVTPDYSIANIDLTPVSYRSKGDGRFRLGLIADWIADQDTRLGIHDGTDIEDYDTRGVIAVLAAKVARLEAEAAR